MALIRLGVAGPQGNAKPHPPFVTEELNIARSVAYDFMGKTTHKEINRA
jgi:hypothetical protein